MLETDKVFAGSIPENYDRHMVPLIFEPFAADLAQRAASLSPSAVLETAAGTGVVTRALAPKLSPGASYIVTDLSQPMLDYAASRQATDSRIKWRQADALALPFENAAFDLVYCQFGALLVGAMDSVAGLGEENRIGHRRIVPLLAVVIDLHAERLKRAARRVVAESSCRHRPVVKLLAIDRDSHALGGFVDLN